MAALAAAALGGWSWGWHEHRRVAGVDFLQQRLALLDQENTRLAKSVADRQHAADAAADRARRGEIERTVARLRGLEFQQPVVYREIPRADLPAILRQKLAQQVPDQEFGNAAISLAALGLLPAGMDLKKTYLDLLGEQIGAFYDQHSAELFTFSGQSLENGQNRVILAHELTHALEDQHFHLARLPLEAKGNDDRVMAASALVEGDATLVMSRYMQGDLSAAVMKDALASAFSTDMRQLAAAPRYLRETLLFPYLRGQEFCQALYQAGGWEALAAAFRNPPDSTAQILHPERFLARRTGGTPVEIKFPDVTVAGQKPVGDNVLGEFGVRQFLSKWLRDEAGANRIGAGWQADRYLVYGDVRASSYLWRSRWSSAKAAAEFTGAAIECWRERYHLDPKAFAFQEVTGEVRQSDDRFARETRLPGGHYLFVLRDEDTVTLIDAQDDHWKDALGELLGERLETKSLGDVRVH